MSFREELLSGTFWTAFASLAGKVFAFLTSIIILKLLSVEETGIFSYGLTVINTLIPIFSLNFGSLAIYFLPKLKNPEKQAFTLLIAAVGFLILSSIIVFLLKNPILDFLNRPGLSTYYLIILVTGILYAEYSLVILISQSLKKFRLMFFCSLGQSFLLFLFLLFDYLSRSGLIAHYKVTGLFIYYILSYVPFILLVLFKTIKFSSFSFNKSVFLKFFRMTLNFHLIFLVNLAVSFIVRTQILKNGAANLAGIQVFDSYYLIFGTLLGSVSLVLIPMIQSKKLKDQKSYEKLQKHLSILYLLLISLFILSFKFFTKVLFGTKYDFLNEYYFVYSLGYNLYFLVITLTSMSVAFEDSFWKVNIALTIGQLFFLAASFLFAKDIVGYAISIGLNGLFLLASLMILVKRIRIFIFNEWKLFVASILVIVLAASLTLLSVPVYFYVIFGVVLSSLIFFILKVTDYIDKEIVVQTLNFLKNKLMLKKSF